MTAVVTSDLKRAFNVDGADYVVAITTEGLGVLGKGKRGPAVELLWRELLNGDAALATALNASLVRRSPPDTNSAAVAKARRPTETLQAA